MSFARAHAPALGAVLIILCVAYLALLLVDPGKASALALGMIAFSSAGSAFLRAARR